MRRANILRSDQYTTDPEGGTFFLRMEFTLAADVRDGFPEGFGLAVAERFAMTWRLWDSTRRKRVGCSSHATTTACRTCSGARDVGN
jgi:formyltetrahydrofolate deformylase